MSCLYCYMMEPKKISFGFTKKFKAPISVFSRNNVEKEEKKVELIKCLEEQSIIILNEKVKEPDAPLVIPMKESTKTSAALASLKARQDVLDRTEHKVEEQTLKKEEISNETIEQRAARELLEETQNKGNGQVKDSGLTVPVKADELPLDGAAEPTIDDYENIPIAEYGLAMLRGMGFKGEIQKEMGENIEGPAVRPKGMGLGADKMSRPKPLLIPPESNEQLVLKKNACVRILVGKHKDLYGQIEGLDDDSGRIIVKLAVGGNRESFSEFMIQPVSKKEYAEYGKVINSAKYEQYKKYENEHGQIIMKTERAKETSSEKRHNLEGQRDKQSTYRESDSRPNRNENHRESRRNDESSSKKHSRRNLSDSETEPRIGDRKRNDSSRRKYDSDDSQNSRRDHSRNKKKSRKSHKERRHRSSSSEDDKRHKKKTKKSKRPRSRSRGRK